MEKKCEFCGEIFEMRSSRSRFCSPGCSNKHRYHTDPVFRQKKIDDSRKRLAENPDALAVVLAAGKRWRESHREEASAASRRWYENNKERCVQNSKEWRDANPGKMAEYSRQWRADNPERSKMHDKAKRAKRVAEKKGNGGSFSADEFMALFEAAGWECAYCGCALDSDSVTADHIIPLSRGGSSDIDNIAPACRSCNSRKHDKTADEFIEWLKPIGIGDTS